MSINGKASGNGRRNPQPSAALEMNPLRSWFSQIVALVGFLLALPVAIALTALRLRG